VTSLDQFEARHLDNGTPQGRLDFMATMEYADAYAEVMGIGGDGVNSPTSRTAEQAIIGMFWGYDGRPGLGTPPRLYNQILREVAVQEGNSPAENARLFALANVAMADAGLTSWDDKYEADFWRPILGIRHGADDGNPATTADPNWTPLGAQASNPQPGELNFTPPFPAYTSGHATFGAAALQTAALFYGRDDIAFTFTSDEFNGVTLGSDGQVRPLTPRSFSSFSEAKLENAESRIYLGIHWRFDADEGIATGDAVATYVFDHFMQPSGHRGPMAQQPAPAPAAVDAAVAALFDHLGQSGLAPRGHAALEHANPLLTSPLKRGDDARAPSTGTAHKNGVASFRQIGLADDQFRHGHQLGLRDVPAFELRLLAHVYDDGLLFRGLGLEAFP
jgi:hypothetical protein